MGVARIGGNLALAALPLSVLGLCAGVASAPSNLLPASRGGFPGWLSGPLHGLAVEGTSASFQVLLLLACACYLVIVATTDALATRALWAAALAAHLAVFLGPPLLSADVFGYLDFARLGVLHGLDPYTHVATDAPHDAVFPYLGWHNVRSPYGPLWTLLSYALVPLGVPAGLWALKALAVGGSLGTAALLARAAAVRGGSPRRALAFFALNPLLLVFAVGGAHNETVLALLSAAGLLALLAGRERLGAAALVGAVAVKASAALALPFALLGARRRRGFVLACGAALLVALAGGVLGFGVHAGTFVQALRGQQNLVALHSIPSELSRGVGLGRLASGVRLLFLAVLGASLLASLVLAWRRPGCWLEAYGWATLALLCCTAWLLPWYGIWALVPAAISDDRRLRAATLGFSLYLVATRLALLDPLLG
ncbi:MAG: hypothetical protein NVSMB51_11650 [Solirubrobacteraceae bacterium]